MEFKVQKLLSCSPEPSTSMSTCRLTVAIPTYRRPEALLKALQQIYQCQPRPDEVIVHIDGNDSLTEAALQGSEFKEVIIIKNSAQVGPGGGRNLAIARAKNPIVASFDDDSYPIDSDYFARLLRLFEIFPDAAVIGSAIFHQGETITPDECTAAWVADFVGCGCAYRRDIFLQTGGYVQLPVAYGMEEADLSLRLHHLGWKILSTPWLRVFHDTRLEHHSSAKVTAASIANQALLTYLRYPAALWWLGAGQCLSRIRWLIQHGRLNGIRRGIVTIPELLWQHQTQRQPLSAQSVRSFLQLRRNLPNSFLLEL